MFFFNFSARSSRWVHKFDNFAGVRIHGGQCNLTEKLGVEDLNSKQILIKQCGLHFKEANSDIHLPVPPLLAVSIANSHAGYPSSTLR